MRVKNEKLWEHLKQNLKDFEIEAGWFENTKYEDGTSVALVARVQNNGAVISNPGGTPYFYSALAQRAVFVHKNTAFSFGLPQTKPHTIVIPPRPFMEHARERLEGKEGKKILLNEMLRVFEGKQTMEQATERIGMWIQAVIQEEIGKIHTPPLAKSTIRARNSRYVTKSKNKSTKPLVDTGIMFATVQHKVNIK